MELLPWNGRVNPTIPKGQIIGEEGASGNCSLGVMGLSPLLILINRVYFSIPRKKSYGLLHGMTC